MSTSKIRELFTKWIPSTPMPPPAPSISPLTPPYIKKTANLIPTTSKYLFHTTIPVTPLSPRDTPSPMVVPPPRVMLSPRVIPYPRMVPPYAPVAHCTRSCQPIVALAASNSTYLYNFLNNWVKYEFLHPTKDLEILDTGTGKSLEHCQLRRHPHFVPTWNTLYANKLDHICKGIDTSPDKTTQKIKVINTLYIIDYDDTPNYLRKEVTYLKVLCMFLPHKQYHNHTHNTIGINHIK